MSENIFVLLSKLIANFVWHRLCVASFSLQQFKGFISWIIGSRCSWDAQIIVHADASWQDIMVLFALDFPKGGSFHSWQCTQMNYLGLVLQIFTKFSHNTVTILELIPGVLWNFLYFF